MRDIYANAERVIAFLGRHCYFTNELFDCLCSSQFDLRKEIITAMTPSATRGLHEVLNRPYWTRAWIIQEIASARRVHVACGNKLLEWSKFIRILEDENIKKLLQSDWPSNQSPLHHVVEIDKHRKQSPMPLMRSLRLTRSARSSDPRDGIYAKLGLALDGSYYFVQPDYSQTVELIAHIFTKLYIEMTYDLYIICFVEGTDQQLFSWVPDWTRTEGRWPLMPLYTEPVWSGSNIGLPRPQTTFSMDLRTISVLGARLDIIGQFAPTAHNMPSCALDATSMLSTICETVTACFDELPVFSVHHERLFRNSRRFAKIFALRASSLDQLWQKTRNPTTSSASTVSSMDFTACYSTNRTVKIGRQTLSEWIAEYVSFPGRRLEEPDELITTDVLMRAIALTTWKRQLSGTAAGRPILAPEAARPGDMVCWLYGCPVPVVLRKQMDHCVLVGECYVSGLINGTMVAEMRSLGRLEETIFNIR